MDKYTKVYPYNEMLFGHKKEWSNDTCYNMDEHWKHYTKWKQTHTKKTHVVCDSTQMKCPEQASSYTQKKSVSGCQGRRKQDWDWLLMSRVSIQGDKHVLQTDNGDSCTTVWMY